MREASRRRDGAVGVRKAALGARRKVDCSFECPARGRIDFGVWPRAGETSTDAAWRGLRDVAKVDTAQIPHCKLLRARYVD
jgi:hypothetical protein